MSANLYQGGVVLMALNYQVLGKKIQLLRIEHSISQLKFAEMIEKSPTFVSRMERGTKHPSLETLVNIALVLGVSIDDLLAENMDLLYSKKPDNEEKVFKFCTAYERYVLHECIKELKRILREGEKIRGF